MGAVLSKTSASATAERGAWEGEAGPEGAGGRGQTEAPGIRDACGVSQGWYLVFSWQHGSATQIF